MAATMFSQANPYEGKTVLITGASSGIGRAFAISMAKQGASLVLTARSEDQLRKLSDDLAHQYSVKSEVIAVDLSKPEMVKHLVAEVQRRQITIDVLINNAGFATNGAFESLSPERDHDQIMVDVTAVVDLCHAFIPQLLQRPEGSAIINVASTAGFQPLPYMAVYGASKAFVLSFTEALAEEYRDRGLRILALCPGSTDTPFFQVAGESASFGAKRTVDQVVGTALRALKQNRAVVVDGWMNALVTKLPRFLPRRLVAQIAGNSVKPR